MPTPPSDGLARRDVATDLQAAVGARRELGPDMEDYVLEAFLARVEERIDARVDDLVRRGMPPSQPVEKKRHGLNPNEAVPATLGVAIPLVVLAGVFAGVTGVVAVMVAVVFIVFLMFAHDILT